MWYDRVENLVPENQHLYIYGFVSTSHPNAQTIVGKEFEIRYDLYVRGKNAEDEEWTFHTPKSEQTAMADCRAGHNLCTYFPVGYVPFIKFDMYDIAIIIQPSETLNTLEATSIDFHVAYFDIEFTHQQLRMRACFTAISAIAFVCFAAKTLCRIKPEDQGSLAFETMSSLTLLFLLFLFNDPFYPVHVYDPRFLTFALSEFQTSLFIAGMLIFWLRDVARHKNPDIPANASRVQKFLHQQQGYNKGVMTFLGVFYVVLVLDFMTLYCLFYVKVEGDPGAGDFGNSELSVNQQVDPALFWALLATCGVLTFYYIMFGIAICSNMRIIASSDCTTKVVFLFSQMVHVAFICGMLLGVYSRHFMNGGLQMFFYGICNLYVYALAYLSWPVEVSIKEYKIDEEQEQNADADPDVAPAGAQEIEMEDRGGQEPAEKLELEEEEKEARI